MGGGSQIRRPHGWRSLDSPVLEWEVAALPGTMGIGVPSIAVTSITGTSSITVTSTTVASVIASSSSAVVPGGGGGYDNSCWWWTPRGWVWTCY
jgi:hypothetical protein